MAVPKLRFKDSRGREFPEWEEKKLGEFCNITTGNSNVDENLSNGKYRFFDRGIDVEHYLDSYFLDTEAIIYAGEGSSFLPRYFNGKFALHQRCYALFDFKNINAFYLYYYLTTCNNHFLKYAVGSTVKSLRMNSFKSCKVKYPSLPEQQKIADFLTAYDTMIDTQTKRVEAMKVRKKGLLQKIFSQEIRFKDAEGKDFPEWEEKCLEKISSVYDGVHQTPNYVETGVPFVSVENINDLENTNKFISMEDFKKDFKVYPEKDDILMTRIGDIGTSALVPKEGFAYYVSLALIKTKKNAIIPKFLNQYIKSNIFQHELYKRSLQYAFPKKINKD